MTLPESNRHPAIAAGKVAVITDGASGIGLAASWVWTPISSPFLTMSRR
jgi:hypothetical protein